MDDAKYNLQCIEKGEAYITKNQCEVAGTMQDNCNTMKKAAKEYKEKHKKPTPGCHPHDLRLAAGDSMRSERWSTVLKWSQNIMNKMSNGKIREFLAEYSKIAIFFGGGGKFR